MKKLNQILYLSLIFFISCFINEATASSYLSHKLQSAFHIENHIDHPLENEFCLKSNRNKQKTIDYWSQKAGFLPQTIPPLHNNFDEAEHVIFFDPKDNLSIEAAYKLGVIHASNMCKKPEIEKAKYYLKKASKKAESRLAYAIILMRNNGKLADIYRLFNEAGTYGIGKGYYNAAILLYKKDNKKYSKKISILLSKAAKNGYLRALNDLGVFMLSEKGAVMYLKPKDQYDKNSVLQYMHYAQQKILKAASLGDKYGLYNSAIIQLRKGCKKDSIRESLSLASDKGFAPATLLIKQLIAKNCFEPKELAQTNITQKALSLFNSEINKFNKNNKYALLNQ